jgi:Tfp pilus assembly protein PilV
MSPLGWRSHNNSSHRATIAFLDPKRDTGFSLVEVAIILVLIGLLLMGAVRAQQLILNARVRDLMAHQNAVEQSVLAFEDRFQAPPGDYAEASTYVVCGPNPCLNGNGNGRIEPGTGGAIREDILAWHHLSAAGFLEGPYQMPSSSITQAAPGNTPANTFGGYLQIAFDSDWGTSTNGVERHNIKTGNHVPAQVLAEVDRKIDDGRPISGRFQFSAYAGAGSAPSGCISADSPGAAWLEADGPDNCGAATLLR